MLPAGFHVSAHRYGQSHGFDRQSAKDKRSPRSRRGKQQDRGNGEKESGWHDQQSGVFHALYPFRDGDGLPPSGPESAIRDDFSMRVTGSAPFQHHKASCCHGLAVQARLRPLPRRDAACVWLTIAVHAGWMRFQVSRPSAQNVGRMGPASICCPFRFFRRSWSWK